MRVVLSLCVGAASLALASCAEYPPPPLASPVVRPVVASATAYCREYQGTADIGGGPQPVYGTACQQPDGTWRLVEAAPIDAPVPPPAVRTVETVRYVPYPAYYPAPYGGPYYYGPRVSIGAAFVFGNRGRRCWRCW